MMRFLHSLTDALLTMFNKLSKQPAFFFTWAQGFKTSLHKLN